MDGLVPMLKSQGNAYISRYTRKKNQSLPPSPIPFTQHDLRDIHKLINSLNEASNTEVQAGRQAQALDLILIAEQLAYILRKKTEGLPDLPTELVHFVTRSQALTYSNLGCQYLSRGKFISALEYLKKALNLQETLKLSPRDLGATCSNITSALYKLGRREETLEYATRTVALIQQAEGNGQQDLSLPLANAHLTLGIALEEVGKLAQAVAGLREGLDVATRRLGSDHFLTLQIQEKLRKVAKFEEFSDAIVSEDQRIELKVVHKGYTSLAGSTHKVVIYRRIGLQELRCVVFPRSKEYVLKMTVPVELAGVEEVLERLEIQQGRLVLGQRKEGYKTVTVSTRHGDARYSAVISTLKSSQL